jgi:hypothetical protein
MPPAIKMKLEGLLAFKTESGFLRALAHRKADHHKLTIEIKRMVNGALDDKDDLNPSNSSIIFLEVIDPAKQGVAPDASDSYKKLLNFPGLSAKHANVKPKYDKFTTSILLTNGIVYSESDVKVRYGPHSTVTAASVSTVCRVVGFDVDLSSSVSQPRAHLHYGNNKSFEMVCGNNVTYEVIIKNLPPPDHTLTESHFRMYYDAFSDGPGKNDEFDVIPPPSTLLVIPSNPCIPIGR